jgi:hypothetical protein
MSHSSKTALLGDYKKGVPIKAITLIVLGVNTNALHDYWVFIYEKETSHRGKPEAIKYMKALYGQAVSYSLYQPLPHIPFRKRLKCNLVKDLKAFKPLLRGSVPKARAALTILRQYELLYTEPSHDLSTVTDPCTKSSLWYRWAFARWMEKTRRKLPVINISKPKDHLTSKKGPSGYAAMTSWKEDLLSLPQHLVDDLCRLSELFGDELINERIITLKRLLIAEGKTNSSECHSRIQVFPAGGGKTRIIALYDYWTQRTLRAPHQAIFKNLRKIREDSTFGHASAADWLKTVPKGVDIYCYDLTASTDRIPYWMHDIVLRKHLPKSEYKDEIADRIKNLLINREFTLSWDKSQKVTYACGQPMGAYMSWALLAYTHHCIARFCGARRNEYRIIGDDIVILGKAGPKYRKFMTSNGIQISESKSIVSLRDDKHQTGEVAKRLILDGHEISPPTANLIYKTFRDWRLGPMLLQDMVRRGWELQAETLLELLSSLYSKSWVDKITTVLTFPFSNDEGAPYIKGVTQICRGWERYDNRELANLFVRYRIEILERAAFKTSKSYDIGLLIGAAPLGTDPDIYNLSPEKNVRKVMKDKTLETIRRLDVHAREILRADEETIIIPRIQDEELYYPDISFSFLEKKYQRQQYYSNTLLTFKRMLDNGTLQSFLRS